MSSRAANHQTEILGQIKAEGQADRWDMLTHVQSRRPTVTPFIHGGGTQERGGALGHRVSIRLQRLYIVPPQTGRRQPVSAFRTITHNRREQSCRQIQAATHHLIVFDCLLKVAHAVLTCRAAVRGMRVRGLQLQYPRVIVDGLRMREPIRVSIPGVPHHQHYHFPHFHRLASHPAKSRGNPSAANARPFEIARRLRGPRPG